ncbi:MAG: MATE family efflux transporter [Clostridia bacterium]|nr:MATE family efflux transporter [Clostridia bacterium]
MKKQIDMTSGPLFKNLLKVALPLAFSGILQLIFNAADLIVVGRFSQTPDESIAAVGSTGSLVGLIINLALGLSVGANVVMAQALGGKNGEKAVRTMHTAILLALFCGVLMGGVLLVGAPTFLTWMDSPTSVIGKSTLYLRIYALGIPANILYNFGAAILRAKGDTTRPMIFLTVAGVVNVGLNILLVLLGFDVAGVAIATAVSHYISAFLLILALCKETDVCRLEGKKLRLHREELIDIIKIGLPSGILSCCFSLSNVIIQTAINGFGDVLTSANSVAGNIEGFVYTSMNAVAMAALTFSGQNFGAKKYERIPKIMGVSCLLVLLVWTVIGGLVLLLRAQIAGLYNANPEIIQYAAARMLTIVPFYALCAFNDVFVSGLRSMNRTVGPMFISLFCTCIFRILWVFTACKIIAEPFMLYLSYPISWTLNLSLAVLYFIVVYKKTLKKAKNG